VSASLVGAVGRIFVFVEGLDEEAVSFFHVSEARTWFQSEYGEVTFYWLRLHVFVSFG
jgi:hypothetical protein